MLDFISKHNDFLCGFRFKSNIHEKKGNKQIIIIVKIFISLFYCQLMAISEFLTIKTFSSNHYVFRLPEIIQAYFALFENKL